MPVSVFQAGKPHTLSCQLEWAWLTRKYIINTITCYGAKIDGYLQNVLQIARRVLFLMMASIAIGTGLLFLTMTVAPWAAICRAYSPSSASGRDTASAEPECNAPPHSNPNNIRVNLTDEQWQELQLEGRCYLACVIEQYQVDYNYVRTIEPLFCI